MASSKFRVPAPCEQDLLNGVQLRLLDPDDGLKRERFRDLMSKHRYLKSDTMVGEQLRYGAEAGGKWVALLGWCAAANHLRDREQWLGWDAVQRRCRLALVANNARFLILPDLDCPNLASRVLALCCARLADDWQRSYGHPNVSGGEDSSRARNRNAITVLGTLRRCAVGDFYEWRRKRKNLRQSTFMDFHDAMNKFNHTLAFATITARP